METQPISYRMVFEVSLWHMRGYQGWHCLVPGFPFLLNLFCVKCNVSSAQFMSGSLLHNGMKRSGSESAGVYSHYVFTPLDVRTDVVLFVFLSMPFVSTWQFPQFALLAELSDPLKPIDIVHLPQRRTKDQSQAAIGQELCGQRSDWLWWKQATVSHKNRYFYLFG